jgi:manganese/zinc/iron transport system substrate-binding protein
MTMMLITQAPKKFMYCCLLSITLFFYHIAGVYSQPGLSIVATTSMLGDAIKHIVQDSAMVITLMGPGIDPHVYKASPRDIKNLSQADVIFYNGLHLEGKMADVLHNFSKRKPVYAASNALDSIQYLGDPNFAEGVDPHIWFDVALWKQVVNYISLQLQAMDQIAAPYYKANTALYFKQLDELHQTTQEAIQQIPKNQRVLITAHDAFAYFGRAYQIEVKGLQGISTVEECGLRDITDLVDFIITRKIKAIFPESSVADKPLRAVVEGCKKRGHQVILGPELYSDALGQAGTSEGTYVGMMNCNVKTIVNALK